MVETERIALQDRLNPGAGIRQCYGCGADNEKGLRIKSFLVGDEGVSTWRAQEHHCSYPGYLNGGVACTLIDCHSAWTAFALQCREEGIAMEESADAKTGWTRAMHVEFLRPTPLDAEITLRAKIKARGKTSRTLTCSLYAHGQECVRAEVTIVFA
jgi:acyl-coenzyme A thioesterase PaaI-like protein